MPTSSVTADILIAGAGIAGASLAARLAGHARVTILEMEDQPGYHATGRSAANYEPLFGPPVIRALTLASGDFYRTPPNGFAEAPLLQFARCAGDGARGRRGGSGRTGRHRLSADNAR